MSFILDDISAHCEYHVNLCNIVKCSLLKFGWSLLKSCSSLLHWLFYVTSLALEIHLPKLSRVLLLLPLNLMIIMVKSNQFFHCSDSSLKLTHVCVFSAFVPLSYPKLSEIADIIVFIIQYFDTNKTFVVFWCPVTVADFKMEKRNLQCWKKWISLANID